jgi:hypothetical protein
VLINLEMSRALGKKFLHVLDVVVASLSFGACWVGAKILPLQEFEILLQGLFTGQSPRNGLIF